MNDLSLLTNNIQDMGLLIQKAYAPSTITAYKNDQNTFIELIGKDLIQATPLDILDFLVKLKLKGYASSTIERKICSLSKQFSVLILGGFRDNNPVETVKALKKNLIPKHVKRIDKTLAWDDIACFNHLKNNKTSLLIELLYSTGARISEVLDIKKQDIKPWDRFVSKVIVLGKGGKERTLFVENSLIERIQENFITKSEYLIHTKKGSRANRQNEALKIKSLIKKFTGKNTHPHQLRHLYATTQIIDRKQSVKAVSKYLGHSSTAITLDMYVDDELSSSNAILKPSAK